MCRNNSKIEKKKALFKQSAFFYLFEGSLKSFLLKDDYSKCFPALFKEGITPEAVAQAFSLLVMFRPEEAFPLFGEYSLFSYQECLENFKNYAIDYNSYYKVRRETHD